MTRLLGAELFKLRTTRTFYGLTGGCLALVLLIVVRDRSGEDIGRLVAEHRLVISELSRVGTSLEEVFFELTEASGGPS